MSQFEQDLQQDCQSPQHCPAVELLIQPRDKDLGGFSVRRVLPMRPGENIGNRYIDWNFVSSRKERIQQARRDWAEGRFALVPGDDQEFISLPE